MIPCLITRHGQAVVARRRAVPRPHPRHALGPPPPGLRPPRQRRGAHLRTGHAGGVLEEGPGVPVRAGPARAGAARALLQALVTTGGLEDYVVFRAVKEHFPADLAVEVRRASPPPSVDDIWEMARRTAVVGKVAQVNRGRNAQQTADDRRGRHRLLGLGLGRLGRLPDPKTEEAAGPDMIKIRRCV